MKNLLERCAGYLVKADTAQQFRPTETANDNETINEVIAPQPPDDNNPGAEELPKKFYGRKTLSSERPGRDFQSVVENIIEHLSNIDGTTISLNLEIEAETENGISSDLRRILLENARSLGFDDSNVK